MSDLFLTVPAVLCETCNGEGKVYGPGAPWGGDLDEDYGACPDCVNGLVPSPEATEAAAEANWYEWHKGHPGGFKGAMRAMARASLFAAALTPGDTESDPG